MGITMLPVDSSGKGSQGQVNPGVYGAVCGEGYQVFDTYLFPADKGEGAASFCGGVCEGWDLYGGLSGAGAGSYGSFFRKTRCHPFFSGIRQLLCGTS